MEQSSTDFAVVCYAAERTGWHEVKRRYYRILCQQLAIFVVYFDAAQNTWVLETVAG